MPAKRTLFSIIGLLVFTGGRSFFRIAVIDKQYYVLLIFTNLTTVYINCQCDIKFDFMKSEFSAKIYIEILTGKVIFVINN